MSEDQKTNLLDLFKADCECESQNADQATLDDTVRTRLNQGVEENAWSPDVAEELYLLWLERTRAEGRALVALA